MFNVVRNENDEPRLKSQTPTSNIIRPKAHGKLTKKIEHERPQAHGKLTKKIHKGHPVKPPTKPRKDTLKGKTKFETDFPKASKIITKGPKIMYETHKKMGKDIGRTIKKTVKKVKKYFTER